MNRKKFIKTTSLAAAGVFLSKFSSANNVKQFPVVRISKQNRKFSSNAVESIIQEVQNKIANKEIAWMFENCFPNTLDTTVEFEIMDGKPDTYVITGDIDAMWLRDSSAQVWPYLPLCFQDENLKQLIKGVINRQVKCILLDPYANAFYKDFTTISEWKDDLTTMKPGIHERKWEIDSLCYPIRLSYGYWKETNDSSIFSKEWVNAMNLIIKTFKEQQRFNDKGPYKFQRTTAWATDGVPLGGYGYPTKKIGLIHSMFRPSDDATVFPFLIPSNLFALNSLQQLKEIIEKNNQLKSLINLKEIDKLILDIENALFKYSIIHHEIFGKIFAFEINGFGSYHLMDDSNIPSLISLQYLFNSNSKFKEIFSNTRKFCLSKENPFFFSGKVAEGIGGPHCGIDMIWPMSLIMRGITSTNDEEIKYCIQTLQKTHANTGFMHESFHKDDATNFTRKWFAWANTLFGEFIWKIYKEKPYLLN